MRDMKLNILQNAFSNTGMTFGSSFPFTIKLTLVYATPDSREWPGGTFKVALVVRPGSALSIAT